VFKNACMNTQKLQIHETSDVENCNNSRHGVSQFNGSNREFVRLGPAENVLWAKRYGNDMKRQL
jgi:hypothetical protein